MAISTRFITSIRYYKGLLEMYNNMTYIFDPSWKADNSVKATFPVCFFHVKSCHEAMTSEVSQKQMLFYNSTVGKLGSDPSLDSGLLNVVADNIVIKPKVYKLDVVIPYNNLTLLDQSFVYNTHTAQAITSSLIKLRTTDQLKKFDQIQATYATLSQPYIDLIKLLLKTLMTTNATSVTGVLDDWIGNISHQPDYNKQSLEIMWRMRHIVKMKMWNSWDYKYVAISDIDITKEGTEDGVYEATLTLQEMPIVTMYAQESNKVKTVFEQKNPLLNKRGEMAIKVLNSAGGVATRIKNAMEGAQ